MTETTLETIPMQPKVLKMLKINEVRLSGRLVRDPEIRSAMKDRVCVHLLVAMNRGYKDGTGRWRQAACYVPITVWNSVAEHCGKRLKKGSPVYVEGRLKLDTWKSGNGEQNSALKVEAFKIQFLARENPPAPVPEPAAA